ncbi:hypothetical protein D0T57_15525, partial [Dysgonomonas sp. 511]|nr:hypothetical protein [Dysgonomonas sp. 511]
SRQVDSYQYPDSRSKPQNRGYFRLSWKGGGAPDQGYVTYYQDRETQTAGGGKAHEKGYSAVLYLDAKEKKYLDECGPANSEKFLHNH